MNLPSNHTLILKGTDGAPSILELSDSELACLWCVISDKLGLGGLALDHPEHAEAWHMLATHIGLIIERGGQQLS